MTPASAGAQKAARDGSCVFTTKAAAIALQRSPAPRSAEDRAEY